MLVRTLVHRILKRGKIHSVAILELDGTVKLHSEDLELSVSDISTITATLNAGGDASSLINLMRLPLRNTTFTCMFQAACGGEPGPLVGRTDNLMFAAVKTSKYVVLGFSDLDSPGSCIYEISEMGKALELRVH